MKDFEKREMIQVTVEGHEHNVYSYFLSTGVPTPNVGDVVVVLMRNKPKEVTVRGIIPSENVPEYLKSLKFPASKIVELKELPIVSSNDDGVKDFDADDDYLEEDLNVPEESQETDLEEDVDNTDNSNLDTSGEE